jgi:hypothetical protein
MFVWKHNQDDEPNAAQEAQDAEELGVALAHGVTTATPDEHDETNYLHEQADDGDAFHAAEYGAENLKQDSNANADVCFSFILCEHTFVMMMCVFLWPWVQKPANGFCQRERVFPWS